MARRRRSALRRALRHMTPNRVAARYLSGGKHQTFSSIARSPFKAKTVHTGKSGRRAYKQRMARERRARVAEAAKARKQATADQQASRAQIRAQRPRQRAARQPVAIDARTGKPVTMRQARKAVREAEARANRLAKGLPGDPPTRRSKAPTPEPERTPLQRAIDEVKRQQQGGSGKPAAKKTARTKPRPKPRKPSPARKPGTPRRNPLADALARLIPDAAVTAPPAAGRATPAPARRRRGPSPKGVYGAVLAHTCACGGTGRIPLLDAAGNPNGAESCPTHGRAGRRRGRRKWTSRGAIRESGLPGLAARLERKQKNRHGNADKRQETAHKQAAKQVRHAGPTRKCGACEHSSGIADKPVTDGLRAQHVREQRAEAETLARMAQAHNAEVGATGQGRAMKVPQVPSEAALRKRARLAFPYELCSSCKGLGRIRSTANAPRAADAQFPVVEWRAGANLRDGHRPTAREKTTGRRPTGNAARVERERHGPRT